jgi:hypothetical protein
MIGEPLDADRMPQAVRQAERKPIEATTRIRRPASANENRLRDDRVAFIKVVLIARLFLNELVATVQVFLPERCRVDASTQQHNTDTGYGTHCLTRSRVFDVSCPVGAIRTIVATAQTAIPRRLQRMPRRMLQITALDESLLDLAAPAWLEPQENQLAGIFGHG